jgi:biopolymer transport protein ExbD
MASADLAVSVNAEGKFFIDRTPVAVGNLESSLKAKIRANNLDAKTTTITVAADKAATVENMVIILEVANRLHLKTILATDPNMESKK